LGCSKQTGVRGCVSGDNPLPGGRFPGRRLAAWLGLLPRAGVGKLFRGSHRRRPAVRSPPPPHAPGHTVAADPHTEGGKTFQHLWGNLQSPAWTRHYGGLSAHFSQGKKTCRDGARGDAVRRRVFLRGPRTPPLPPWGQRGRAPPGRGPPAISFRGGPLRMRPTSHPRLRGEKTRAHPWPPGPFHFWLPGEAAAEGSPPPPE